MDLKLLAHFIADFVGFVALVATVCGVSLIAFGVFGG